VYIGIGGGFCSMTPTNDYAFTYKNDAAWGWSGRFLETTGQKSDIGFNITSSIEFQLPTAPISLTAGISYVQLYGTTESVRANSPPWYNTVFTVGELKTRSNLLTIRSGAKWEFIHSGISPYLSLELLYNIIGETNLSIHTTSSTIDAVVDGNTSFGLSLGGGVRTSIFPSMDVSVGAAYAFNNLVSPETHIEQKNLLCIGVGLLFRVL
jgi:hypothetical protein